MSIASIASHIRGTARRFVRADQGNIAVLFGIALLPILTFVGAAIDYSRANRARSSMQAALDSTALMLSKDLAQGVIAASDVNAKAKTYFAALYTNTDSTVAPANVQGTYTAKDSTGASTIVVTGSGYVTSDFMQVVGFPQLNFNTGSTTSWGTSKMRVALALDNTGSMAQNGKITALRTAVAGTGGLIDQLSALATTNGDVYISMIPFAKIVNANSSNYGQNWIDWTDWLNPPTAQPNNGSNQATLPMNWHAVGPGAKCPFTSNNDGFGCTTGPGNASSTTNAVPSTTITINGATLKNPICPSIDANSHSFYNGCWESEPTIPATQIFCSGSSSCSCPTTPSGSTVAGCSCSGSGTGRSCTGLTYVHNWSQPGPIDLIHNLGQPRVSAFVGFANNRWTAATSTPSVENNWIQASTNPINTWTGCITDRTQPNDATGVLPTSSNVTTLFPANQHYENSTAYCDSSASTQLEPMIPLSYNWSSLKTAVNAMQPTGGTNQAVGLAWAWQSLLPGGPLNVPAEDSNTTYNRVIILLSDGLNTEDRWPDYGNGSTQFNGSIDARQSLLCSNLKNAKDSNGQAMYTIYTIQVNTDSPADPTSTVLQSCASSPDKFYMLTSSAQIVTTFNAIGTALSKLRVKS